MYKILGFIVNATAVFLLVGFANVNTFMAIGIIVMVALINFVDGMDRAS